MKTFEVSTPYCTEPECTLSYDMISGHVSIQIWCPEGPFAALTRFASAQHPANFAYVDVNNFPQAIELIDRLGIGKPTNRCGYSGFCSYPLYEFDMEALKEWAEGE